MQDPRTMTRIPVPVWGALASTACLIIGWNWDVSWHRSIGRDTLWTLPHVAIYIALAIAVAYNFWLFMAYTFGSARDLPAVQVFGFRGPSATFVTTWGCLMQFTGIVFDDFWHAAYGLDIGVFSPAHAVLGFGILVFYFGQFALVAWYYNHARPELKSKLRWIMLLIWSFFLGNPILSPDPAFGPMAVRSAAFAVTTAMFYPGLLVMVEEYFGRRGSGVRAAVLYMLGLIAMMQIFQLFPASPKFGPVYHEVPNFLPPAFPLLLIAPAAAVDWTLHRTREWTRRTRLLASSVVFIVAFNGTNWLSSEFLLSELSLNRFFGGMYPGSFFEEGFRFVPEMGLDAPTAISLVVAVAMAYFSSLFGSRAGRWLRRVER